MPRKNKPNIDRFGKGNREKIIQQARAYEFYSNKAGSAEAKLNSSLPMDLIVDKDLRDDLLMDIRHKYPIIPDEAQALNILARAQMRGLREAEIIKANDQDPNPPYVLRNTPIVRATEHVFDRCWVLSQAQCPNHNYRPIYVMLLQGQLHSFFSQYFKTVDTRQGFQATSCTNQMLEVLGNALNHDKNLPLQEFYGSTFPKEIRGQLKTSSNFMFQDTDTLCEFINKYFFLGLTLERKDD